PCCRYAEDQKNDERFRRDGAYKTTCRGSIAGFGLGGQEPAIGGGEQKQADEQRQFHKEDLPVSGIEQRRRLLELNHGQNDASQDERGDDERNRAREAS